MKRKHIYCDNKKLYHLSKEHFDQLNSQQKFNLNSFAELATKIINTIDQNFKTFLDPKEVAQFIIFSITFDNEMIADEIRLNRMIIE